MSNYNHSGFDGTAGAYWDAPVKDEDVGNIDILPTQQHPISRDIVLHALFLESHVTCTAVEPALVWRPEGSTLAVLMIHLAAGKGGYLR